LRPQHYKSHIDAVLLLCICMFRQMGWHQHDRVYRHWRGYFDFSENFEICFSRPVCFLIYSVFAIQWCILFGWISSFCCLQQSTLEIDIFW